MKKKLGLFLFISLILLTGCSNNTNKSISDKLKSGGYQELLSTYTKHENDGSYIIIDLSEKTIVYHSEKDDSQLEYNVIDNTAWMYGCRYHYDDNTTTNDGEGFGDCDNDTINFLKNSKSIIDNELKKLNISYDDLK